MAEVLQKRELRNSLGEVVAIATDVAEVATHASGAKSSHYSPFNFNNPFEGTKLTCARFKVGNAKYEGGTTVYAEANWMKAFNAKDINFFRDRSGHALEHLIAEMHGVEDENPGGNLGAVGWWVEIMAYVKAHDPEFYRTIQGTQPPSTGTSWSSNPS